MGSAEPQIILRFWAAKVLFAGEDLRRGTDGLRFHLLENSPAEPTSFVRSTAKLSNWHVIVRDGRDSWPSLSTLGDAKATSFIELPCQTGQLEKPICLCLLRARVRLT